MDQLSQNRRIAIVAVGPLGAEVLLEISRGDLHTEEAVTLLLDTNPVTLERWPVARARVLVDGEADLATASRLLGTPRVVVIVVDPAHAGIAAALVRELRSLNALVVVIGPSGWKACDAGWGGLHERVDLVVEIPAGGAGLPHAGRRLGLLALLGRAVEGVLVALLEAELLEHDLEALADVLHGRRLGRIGLGWASGPESLRLAIARAAASPLLAGRPPEEWECFVFSVWGAVLDLDTLAGARIEPAVGGSILVHNLDGSPPSRDGVEVCIVAAGPRSR